MSLDAEGGHYKVTVKIGERSYTCSHIAPGEDAQFQGVSIEPDEEILVLVEWIDSPE